MTFSMGILKSISKSCKIFYGENLETLFRRLTWSPQGSLLVAPCGIINNGANTTNGGTITTAENAVYIFTRASLTTPGPARAVAMLKFRKPPLVVRFSPYRFEPSSSVAHNEAESPVFTGGNRDDACYLFAVATADTVSVFESTTLRCVCTVGNIHYAGITDLTWARAGLLLVASTDGFVSAVNIRYEG